MLYLYVTNVISLCKKWKLSATKTYFRREKMIFLKTAPDLELGAIN